VAMGSLLAGMEFMRGCTRSSCWRKPKGEDGLFVALCLGRPSYKPEARQPSPVNNLPAGTGNSRIALALVHAASILGCALPCPTGASHMRDDREDVYSKAVRAGKRTYFFDVKSTRGRDLYLTITESKKHTHEDGTAHYDKH